jgi:hypothetical protein
MEPNGTTPPAGKGIQPSLPTSSVKADTPLACCKTRFRWRGFAGMQGGRRIALAHG